MPFAYYCCIMNIFSEKTRIKTYHVTKNGQLSTHQLFNFFQEAAYRHSVVGKFGQPDLANHNLIWMLSRIHVQILGSAILGDEIEIHTWIRSILGSLSERDFRITSNGKTIVEATSLWVCFSKETIRPTHIPAEIISRMHLNAENAFEFSSHKVAALKEWESVSDFKVLPSDIDMVNHTNNVAYVRMAMDALKQPKTVRAMHVNFIRQSYLNDNLTIRVNETEDVGLVEIVNDKEEFIFRMKMTFS